VALLLRIKDPQFFRKRSTGQPVRTIDLDAEPCPTIMANGIRSVTVGRYELVDDGRPPVIDATKPPYRVPSMAEIAAVEPNGLKVISTFAGCGGSSLGYRMAGFKVLWASEFVERARLDYEANAAQGTVVDGRDIRQVDPLEVLRTVGLQPGELDVLDGSPPCASFSTSGKRDKKWGTVSKYSDREQRTDDLFFEFVRFAKAMRPRVFVAENVSGLVKGVAKGYFLEILAAMKKVGYRVEARLLDAQWLGVPQQRQRIIFVGVRRDLGLEPAYPSPLPYRYSVRDALPWISRAIHDTSGDRSVGEITNRPAPTITVGGLQPNACHFKVVEATVFQSDKYTHLKDVTDTPALTIRATPGEGKKKPFVVERVVQGPEVDQRNEGRDLSDGPAPTVVAGDAEKRTPRQFVVEQFVVEPETDISGQAIGKEYDRLNPGQESDKYFNLKRAPISEPCQTVTASGGMNSGIASVTHPTEKRKFSIAELRRVCGFPDDFALGGTYAQQWERMGRAVPPVMMAAIARSVAGVLKEAKNVRPARSVRSPPVRRRRAARPDSASRA